MPLSMYLRSLGLYRINLYRDSTSKGGLKKSLNEL